MGTTAGTKTATAHVVVEKILVCIVKEIVASRVC